MTQVITPPPTHTHKSTDGSIPSSGYRGGEARAVRAGLLRRLPGSYAEWGRDIEVAAQDWARTVWKQINVAPLWRLDTSNVPSKTTASL